MLIIMAACSGGSGGVAPFLPLTKRYQHNHKRRSPNDPQEAESGSSLLGGNNVTIDKKRKEVLVENRSL